MYKILIVDDEKNIRTSLRQFFSMEGIETEEAGNGLAARKLLEQKPFDAVISDLKMPGMDGIDLLRWITDSGPDIPVIIISAFGDIEDAVKAMKQGAVDYVVKPFDPEELLLRVKRELERYRLKNLVPTAEQKERKSDNPVMQDLYRLAERAAPTRSTVLITGESGTGKEVMARYIHDHSDRSTSVFLTINLGAIPDTLMESELFGYEKGAFTGADKRKTGYFEAASGGTIFLDEIGEAPLPLQVKLLGVLQERKITRIGSTGSIPVDIRIIAATNRKLEDMVAGKLFREDLYYRLNVIHLHLPPLRKRPEDIRLLSPLFLQQYALSLGRTVTGLEESAAELLESYDFPGNIRELENMIERALILAEGPLLKPEDFPIRGNGQVNVRKGTLREIERDAIYTVLLKNDGHREKSAGELGISRRTLLNKIKEYGLIIPE